MKCFPPLAALLALAACAQEESAPAAPEPAAPSAADIVAARTAVATLGADLKARLVAAIEEGGPVAAIHVCNIEAPDIAKRISADTAMSVGRTALRYRNPGNAPDAFERETMERFLADIAAGADPAGLERAEIVETAAGLTFRYMKPIMTGGPCVLCHGASLSDEVRAAIAARYPEDQATGFALGDMRGAFTISKPLND